MDTVIILVLVVVLWGRHMSELTTLYTFIICVYFVSHSTTLFLQKPFMFPHLGDLGSEDRGQRVSALPRFGQSPVVCLQGHDRCGPVLACGLSVLSLEGPDSG